MDVINAEQAKIAEEAGACAVMALERVPADIRTAGGVSRMSDPKMIKEIQAAVSIAVMAKVNENIVAARQNNILVSSFHPELTSDYRMHKFFIDSIVKKYS